MPADSTMNKETSAPKPPAHEPEALATAGWTGTFNTNHAASQKRLSDANESRELRGLAKQWDEQDKVAKHQARQGARRASLEQQPGPVAVMNTAPERRRFTDEEQKRRATYLQTGMKPGAFPGVGPDDDPNNPPYSNPRQYDRGRFGSL